MQVSNRREAEEEMKVKDILILDLSKRSLNLAAQLKECTKLYELVRPFPQPPPLLCESQCVIIPANFSIACAQIVCVGVREGSWCIIFYAYVLICISFCLGGLVGVRVYR